MFINLQCYILARLKQSLKLKFLIIFLNIIIDIKKKKKNRWNYEVYITLGLLEHIALKTFKDVSVSS